MSDTPSCVPLSDREHKLFSALVSGDYNNFALASSILDGEHVAVIVAVDWSDGTECIMTPLALLLTPAIQARLIDPGQGL